MTYRPTFLLIKLAVVVAVILVRVFAGANRKPQQGFVPAVDPHNVKGHTCAGCTTQIAGYLDGQRCDHCQAPMHTACLEQHKNELKNAA
jgi:hypothetical protein